MRTALLAVLFVSPVVAGPAPVQPSKVPPAWAQTYAQQVLSAATQVSASYLRPVSLSELSEGALVGLYEAARQPLPDGLLAKVRQAATDVALLEVLQQARANLGEVEDLKAHGALLASCRRMLRRLDPHSDVVLEEDRKNQPWGDQPAGYGFELTDPIGVGSFRIQRVWPGTPAQRAGLRPGDEITHINRRALKGMRSPEVAGLLTQPYSNQQRRFLEGGLTQEETVPAPMSITVRVARPGREPWRLTLDPQDRKPESVLGVLRHDDNSWDYLLDHEQRIAHVRIESLNRGTANELAEVLQRLENKQTRGLILDLRWSPGGFLDEATALAGLFLGDQVIATVRNRGREEHKYHNTQPKRFEKLPLVVLVNGQTSGGSELVVAALQDHKRAVVAGQRTLGKASVQTALYVDIPGANLKLTTGEFLRPSGKNLHRKPGSGLADDWGIKPNVDLECRLSPELTRELKANWDLQTLRPGGDFKVLPLDDPRADPQREVALRYLRERTTK